jgi:hypothetical protein
VTINLKSAVLALGGDVAGRNKIRCPGPGHSRADRSLAVTFTVSGFLVHSFAGDDFRECRDYVKDALGLADDRPTTSQRAPVVGTSERTDERRRIEHAARVWAAGLPLRATIAETYLRSRGLSYDGEALRFHAGNRMMVALMTDAVTGEPCGVHRTFLDAVGNRTKKKMLGRAKGAVVRLCADEDVATGLAITEGIETALAVPFRPVWACLSAGGIERLPVLAGIEALTIFADNDANGAGLAAAHGCGVRWSEAGKDVTVRMIDQVGADYADAMMEAA